MAAERWYGTVQFKNKTAAAKAFGELLQTWPLDRPIAWPWQGMLEAALRDHPDGIERIGVGVDYFFVREHRYQDNYPARGYYIRRLDRSEVRCPRYLDWINADPEAIAWKNFKSAMRQAVSASKHKCKVKAFNGKEEIACPVSCQTMTWVDAHVDHDEPWPFALILSSWMEERGYSRGNLPQVTNGQLSATLSDVAAAADFLAFHDRLAVLQVVHKSVNLGKRKHPA